MPLLERTAELATLSELIGGVETGNGRVVLLEGPPGIGKTELLAAARSQALETGLEVLEARGAELEMDFAFGVVRQLFEVRLARGDASERQELFAGAASLAAPLFGADGADPPPGQPPDPFQLIHGLYWLTVGLAGRRPLVLVVDDAHWADALSMQYLHYLARRIEGLPIVLAAAARSTAPEAPIPIVEAMRADHAIAEIRPGALSPQASAAVLAEVFGVEPDPSFVRAIHELSAGNPFLLTELAHALAADGIRADRPGIPRIEVPGGISSFTLIRLGQLPTDAQSLAVATAVLGDGADFREAAALAGLDDAEAAAAEDALTAAAFLGKGRPLRFEHPLIRSAVYGDLGDADRRRRHKRAAEILRDHSEASERIAAHLLLCDPGVDGWVADSLLDAAGTAMARGAPEAAGRYLRRALSERVPEARAQLLLAVGAADAQALDPRGVEHLQEAVVLAPDQAERLQARRTLAFLHIGIGEIEDAVGVLTAELERLPPEPAEARLELEADLAGILQWGIDDAVDALDQVLARVPPDLAGATAVERSLLASRAYRGAKLGRDADLVEADALRALEAGLLEEQMPGAPAWASAVHALISTDSPTVRKWGEDGARAARAAGSLFALSLCSNLLSIAAFREGALADAEAFAWESLGAAKQLPGDLIGLPAVLSALVDAMLERGRSEEAWAELVALGLDGALPDGSLSALLGESRGRLRLTRNELDEGITDLLEAGDRYTRAGVVAPAITCWRSSAAEALVVAGRRVEARKLAEEDLEAARGFGRPRPIGIALRALGLCLEGEEAIAHLAQAVDVLAPSTARVEHARALCDLGAALRRANRRSEARAPLTEAADLASRCGAVPLAERASDELRATGARPRRVMLSGVESLTASELRVARLAAGGMSNREIAQSLFVTTKTVEKHLGNAYAKLDIGSRDELTDALAAEA